MNFLWRSGFWASLGAILAAVAALGGAARSEVAFLAVLCGVLGVGMALWEAGHRVHYEGPRDEQSPRNHA